MSPQSKREYTEAIHSRYKNATRHEKTVILGEFCAACVSPQTCYQGSQEVQTLYKTKGEEKRETARLSE